MYKYEVKCKCGHVGRSNYIVISFPVVAESGKAAASKARLFPRVKHDHKDAILSVREISDEEFDELLQINRKDSYLHCKNIQEQNLIDLSERIYKEYEEDDEESKEGQKQFFFGKMAVKNPKRFFKNILDVDYRKEAYIW